MQIDFEVISHISKLKIEYFNRMNHDRIDIDYSAYTAIYYTQFGEIKALFDLAELLTGHIFAYSDILEYLNSGKAVSIADFEEYLKSRKEEIKWDH